MQNEQYNTDRLDYLDKLCDKSFTFPKFRYYYKQFHTINDNEKFSLSLLYNYKSDTNFMDTLFRHISPAIKGLSNITKSTYKNRFEKFFYTMETDPNRNIIDNSIFTYKTSIYPLLQPRAVIYQDNLIKFDELSLEIESKESTSRTL